MGAWIETVVPQLETLTIKVAPVWVRGLKRDGVTDVTDKFTSRTRMGAWIETD